jgi:hypothetical protein
MHCFYPQDTRNASAASLMHALTLSDLLIEEGVRVANRVLPLLNLAH